MSSMPPQKPGRSKQDYRTPPNLLHAVKHYLGIEIFMTDLAASAKNAVASQYYTELENSLLQSWVLCGWSWCNPPFGHINPWVRHAWEQCQQGAQLVMLTPASVGANWWYRWVHGKAHVILLNGRVTFVGEATPYPKDCTLLVYRPGHLGGYEAWRWQ